MKPRGLPIPVVALLLATPWMLAETPVEISAMLVPPDEVLLSWPAVPGQSYRVRSTVDLSSAWNLYVTDPAVLVATGDFLSVNVPLAEAVRFFQVAQLDRDFTIPELDVDMVWIPPGTFIMGSPSSERGRWPDEGPRTEVTIGRGFWLGRHEVTQRAYQEVMGSNPSFFKGDPNRPVERVSWNDAVTYCEQLTQRERAANRLPAGYAYGLPTEAQWEYACRAGTTTRFSFGDALGCDDGCGFCAGLDRFMWWCGNSGETTHPVGGKEPNPWGLYDLHGNVWEWCADWWDDRLPGGRVTDPEGPESGSLRVGRGGGWGYVAQYCRSAHRFKYVPSTTLFHSLGFRAALAPVP